MKRIFSLALAFALLCAGITVRAAQHMIVGIGNPIDPRYTPILVLDSGDWEPDALRQELPSFYPCLLKGSFRGYACPVEWDLKAIDPSLRAANGFRGFCCLMRISHWIRGLTAVLVIPYILLETVPGRNA